MKIAHPMKKCPYCNSNLVLSATVCTNCDKKVGPVDEHGHAKKPFAWKDYLIAAISLIALSIYLKFAFF